MLDQCMLEPFHLQLVHTCTCRNQEKLTFRRHASDCIVTWIDTDLVVSNYFAEKKNQIVKKAKHAKKKADGKQTARESKKDL